MGLPLTRRERWIDQVLYWLDWPLLGLTFVFAWFLVGLPAAANAWPESTQLAYRIVVCASVVAGILTLRWRRPVGIVVTFAAYEVLAASQVFSSKTMWLAFAGFMMIAGMLITEAVSRSLKDSEKP